jgi:hypothetical protein
MGRFKRRSKKKYHIPKDAVKQYIEEVKEKKPTTIFTTKYDNRRLVMLIRKVFLSLKRRKKFGEFMECYYPIEKKLAQNTDESIRTCLHHYGHGRSGLVIGKYFYIPISRDLLTYNNILNTPFGNVVWLNHLFEGNWQHKRENIYLSMSEISEMYLKDAYIAKGITKSRIPNEMAFAMRIGTILASIFYVAIAFLLACLVSPLASLIYSLFTALTIIYFLFSFPINNV